jgi:hypothetical protein
VFEDGTAIEFTNSSLKVNGLVYGERNVNFQGVTELTYPAHELTAKIDFTQNKGKQSGWFNYFSRKEEEVKQPSDHFAINVYRQNGPELEEIVSGRGSWLEDIVIEDR